MQKKNTEAEGKSRQGEKEREREILCLIFVIVERVDYRSIYTPKSDYNLTENLADLNRMKMVTTKKR